MAAWHRYRASCAPVDWDEVTSSFGTALVIVFALVGFGRMLYLFT